MKKIILAIAAAAVSCFAGTWTTAAVPSEVTYMYGCGTDTNKVILQVNLGGTYYFTKSDNPAFSYISNILETAHLQSKNVKVYISGGYFTYYYSDFSACSSTSAYRFNFAAIE